MVWDETLMVVLAVLICLVNIIFVILLYHRGSLNKLQNALLLSLGCSNLCVSFFATPSVLLCSMPDVVTSIRARCLLCILSYLLNRFIAILSLIHLMAVIYERYLKILHPFWFQKKEYTLFRSARIVPALWLASLVISCVPLTWWPWKTPCGNSASLREYVKYFDCACLGFFLLLLLFMFYAFVRIFLVVRVHLHDIDATDVQLSESMDVLSPPSNAGSLTSPELAGNNILESTRSFRSESKTLSHTSTRSSARRQMLMREARIVIRFAVMVFTFILFWGIYFVVSVREEELKDVSLLTRQLLSFLRFMNPLVDPWILMLHNKDFQLSCYFRRVCDFLRRCYATFVQCFPRKAQPSGQAGNEKRASAGQVSSC